MKNLEFCYPAVEIHQSEEGKPLILFGAPAIEIERWAGVPQKKDFSPEGSETSGFQRSENAKRLEQLKRFYSNKKNVVQNSLICSLKKVEGAEVKYITSQDNGLGNLHISFPDFQSLDLVNLFSMLRTTLESRLECKSEPNPQLIQKLKEKLSSSVNIKEEDNDFDIEEDIDMSSSAVFEESHIEEFLNEVVARESILNELKGDAIQRSQEFLGFRRDALLSFLLPITLVDGQHRLKGAILAAKESISSPESQDKIAQKISAGENPDVVYDKIISKNSRILPVSLLMEDDPMEQVFQFVIINQKATPIGKSLLGTIISTSLTPNEMEAVSDRLKQSGVELEAARAITWAARNPESPFFNLVERGLDNESSNLLKWSVMGNLITIFKELRGGALFHSKVDYAKRWRDKYLVCSDIVDGDSDETAYDNWSKLDGVWMKVFVIFWSKIKLEFGQSDNPDRFNFWGNPRKSNLFNKISLTILAADFFKFLVNSKRSFSSSDDIELSINDWLEDVSRGYFDRDWELSGVKKDSTGIRAKWSENWADYREDPKVLPQIRSYRISKK